MAQTSRNKSFHPILPLSLYSVMTYISVFPPFSLPSSILHISIPFTTPYPYKSYISR